MSRAINIDATIEAITKTCAAHKIGVSAIEPLKSGGTRVVLLSSDGAAELRRRMKTKIMDGPVVRSDFYRARPPVTYQR
jgi:hypothetical protein